MTVTSTVQHSIGCIVCRHNFSYIGSLDSENVLESNSSVIADSVIAIGTHQATDGKHIEVEVVVTCPECKSKQKQLNAAKVVE